jgi:penicillin-binding protein 2
MLEGTKMTIRLVALGLLTVALVFVMGGRLLGMQFIHAEAIARTNERSSFRSHTIHAARGEIYDRYGRPLVTNKLSYNVTINPFSIFMWARPIGEREIGFVREFIRTAAECEQIYTDSLLPVTLPPFEYTEMTTAQKRYLEHYLGKKNWPEEITAAELMDRLFDEYGMTGGAPGAAGLAMSAYEARLVAGVMYELEMRYVSMGIEPYLNVPDYVFASDVSMEFIIRVRENKWPGAEIVPMMARQYNTEAAGHILGRIGPIQDNLEEYLALGYRDDELVGVEGVERAFESWLHGTAGVQRVETRGGHIVGVTDLRQPQAGQNVYLTLDIRFQEEVERTLAEGVARLNATGRPLRGLEAEAATAVIIDVRTGEVLAAANYPTYSPKTYLQDYAELAEDPLRPLFNRAVLGTYAPGSTYKMVTAAAAIESGVVTPSTRIHDAGIYTFYTFPQPRCHIYPGSHGRVDSVDALIVSCNYYFYDVGRRAGINQIVRWAHLFGLGIPTGLELEDPNRTRLGWAAGPEAAEALGIRWYPGNTLSAAIGQDNNLFTPVQLANFTAAIANGGTLYRAHLLKEVISFDYTYEYHISRPIPLHKIDIADSTVRALQQGMMGVTLPGGTAHSVFRGYPISVAGKTGTIQVGSRPNNGVFVCYAPYENPEIAVAVVVEKGGGGSTVAPIARDILDVYFRIQGEMRVRPGELVLR